MRAGSKLRCANFDVFFRRLKHLQFFHLLLLYLLYLEAKTLLTARVHSQSSFQWKERLFAQQPWPGFFEQLRAEAMAEEISLEQAKGKERGVVSDPEFEGLTPSRESIEGAIKSLDLLRLPGLL